MEQLLEKIKEIDVKSPSFFVCDLEANMSILNEEAHDLQKKDSEKMPRYYLFLVTENGSFLFREHNVFIENTPEHEKWFSYQDLGEKVSAYQICLKGESEEGEPIGEISEFDYSCFCSEYEGKCPKANYVIVESLHGNETHKISYFWDEFCRRAKYGFLSTGIISITYALRGNLAPMIEGFRASL